MRAPALFVNVLPLFVSVLLLFVSVLPLALAGCSPDVDPGQPPEPAGPGAAGEELDTIVARAEELFAAENHEQSAVAYARAAELALAAGDLEQHHAFRAQRGVCLKMLGRAVEARAEFLPALAWARAQNVAHIEGLALGNMVRVAGLEGKTTEQLSWYDELVAFAERQGDVRLVVHTLEQSGTLALREGDIPGALLRLDQALALDQQLDPADQRGEALRRQRAWTLASAGDDEGAAALWAVTEPSAASLANQAQHLSMLKRHGEAAQWALDAARRFEQEGAARRGQRDRSLRMFLSELLLDGQLEACESRLAAFLVQSSDPVTLAPWRVIEARLALARNSAPHAVELLRDAAQHQSDEAATETGWLLSAALLLAAQPQQALDVLDELPSSLAVDLLRGWVHQTHPPSAGLATDALPVLLAAEPAGDESVARLRHVFPRTLPSLAFLSLDLSLADADRMRAEGQSQVARLFVQDGLVRALRWQALEARARVAGRWPDTASLRLVWSQSIAWVAGELDEDEAVIAVLPGLSVSYVVVCTAGLGGTTFGIAAESVLARRAFDVAAALRDPSPAPVAAASYKLFTTLIDDRVRADLEGKRRWTLVLPDVLTTVPPPMYVVADPALGGSVAWLVRVVDSRLLPHVGSETSAARGAGWAQLGEPRLQSGRSLVAVPDMLGRYGESILQVGSLRPRTTDDAPRRAGAAATASSLREGLARGATLEVSVPALGGGRLGGLLLAPDPGASWGDESIGFLPWQRLAELPSGGVLILDRSRFGPGSADGAALAATAVMAGGVQTLLMTRWPLRSAIRAGMLGQMDDGGRLGSDVPSWSSRLAATQRLYLAGAEASGEAAAAHPRLWASWLLFGGS